MEKLKIFILGTLFALAVTLLLGATGVSGPGRYQIAASSDAFYVLDTHTGTVVQAGKRAALTEPVDTQKLWGSQ